MFKTLLVDDDVIFRESLRDSLKTKGDDSRQIAAAPLAFSLCSLSNRNLQFLNMASTIYL